MVAALGSRSALTGSGVCHTSALIRSVGWGRISVFGCPNRPAGSLPFQQSTSAVHRQSDGAWVESWGPNGGTPGCKVPHPYKELLGFGTSDQCA